jgi:thymidylate synthase
MSLEKLTIDEDQYLKLMKQVLQTGVKKPNRTSQDTLSIFGAQMRFQLCDSKQRRIFPLLTTKKMFIKSMSQELFWFIKGDTSSKRLHEMGSRIWDANGTREFLDSRGLTHRQEGDLGPCYGYQWRHFNAPYQNCNSDYTGLGIDQLQKVIDGIKKDPFGRRHIVTAWNPCQLNEMALPPCHMFYQFNVRPDEKDYTKPKYLDCQMYQRSADLPLGVPFNIASYSLLVHMISHLTGLIPGEFIHSLGDVHIYENQIPGCKIQLQRTPIAPPYLEFVNIEQVKKIEDFNYQNLKIVDYNPQAGIKFPFSV